jgi:hypothetical protein
MKRGYAAVASGNRASTELSFFFVLPLLYSEGVGV